MWARSTPGFAASHGDFADAHGNLGSGGGFLEDSLDLLRIAQTQFLGAVDDELRSEPGAAGDARSHRKSGGR